MPRQRRPGLSYQILKKASSREAGNFLYISAGEALFLRLGNNVPVSVVCAMRLQLTLIREHLIFQIARLSRDLSLFVDK